MYRRSLGRLAGALSLPFVSSLPRTPAQAQATAWPSRSARVVVPYPTGSAVHLFANSLFAWISHRSGQTISVEPTPADEFVRATHAVAESPRDGHTILLTSVQHVAAQAMYGSKLPYDINDDFTPIGAFAFGQMVLLVKASSPVRSLQDFVYFLRANPARFEFGSPGMGSTSHLAAEMLKQVFALEISHRVIPGDSAECMAALDRGSIDFTLQSTSTALEAIASGRGHAIAQTGLWRSSFLPQVPTFHESGGDVTAGFWYAVFSPALTWNRPAYLVNAAIAEALREPRMNATIRGYGLEPVSDRNIAEMPAFLGAQRAIWEPVAKTVFGNPT